jgi:cytoskeletal protein CcmA (bactofilin family)
MLRNELFGNKKDSTTPTTPNSPNSPFQSTTGTIATGSAGIPKSVAPITGTSTAATTTDNTASSTAEGGSKLIVGPNIKLKGVEITDCDTLVVEGRVEATIDSRVIQIAEIGAFKGSAEIDIAEIRGEFDGDLIVRQKLVVYATGKVSGKVRYGKLVIEEGGQLSGDIQVGTAAANKGLSVAKVG